MVDFREQLQKFIVSNSIIGVAAGFIIGESTKDVISSFVNDILFPLFFKSFGIDKNKLNLIKFIEISFTWILVVILTFVFIQFAVVYLLGIDEKSLEKSKIII